MPEQRGIRSFVLRQGRVSNAQRRAHDTLLPVFGIPYAKAPLDLNATFDPDVAEVSGVRTARTDALLAVLLSALITVCMNVLGVTLIAAMLVVPPVVGRLLTDSFARMLGISVAVGTVCGFVGVYLSYYLDWASGPAVVLTAATIFVAAYAVSGFRRRRLPAAAIDAHVG